MLIERQYLLPPRAQGLPLTEMCFPPVNAKVRIPGHADRCSGLMPIVIPG